MKQENFYLFYQADKDSFFAVPGNADGNHLTQAPEDKKKAELNQPGLFSLSIKYHLLRNLLNELKSKTSLGISLSSSR